MKFFLVLLPAALLAGCSNKGTADLFSSADSLVVQFKAPGADSVSRTVATADRRVIRNLGRFDKGEIEAPNCGANGRLLLYEKGQERGQIQFNSAKGGCAHFTWQANGKRTVRRMSNEGADFFQALASGQTVY